MYKLFRVDVSKDVLVALVNIPTVKIFNDEYLMCQIEHADTVSATIETLLDESQLRRLSWFFSEYDVVEDLLMCHFDGGDDYECGNLTIEHHDVEDFIADIYNDDSESFLDELYNSSNIRDVIAKYTKEAVACLFEEEVLEARGALAELLESLEG